eukprot:1771028-Rhodomonas_salina.3
MVPMVSRIPGVPCRGISTLGTEEPLARHPFGSDSSGLVGAGQGCRTGGVRCGGVRAQSSTLPSTTSSPPPSFFLLFTPCFTGRASLICALLPVYVPCRMSVSGSCMCALLCPLPSHVSSLTPVAFILPNTVQSFRPPKSGCRLTWFFSCFFFSTWNQGILEGHGRYIFADRSEFRGSFQDGRPTSGFYLDSMGLAESGSSTPAVRLTRSILRGSYALCTSGPGSESGLRGSDVGSGGRA